MEKLEPILKQKFWILLGVAILMTLIGWWMATAGMAAVIATRTTEIEKSFSEVPDGAIPNESWAKRLGAINVDQDKSIKVTRVGMWKRQLAKMTFPEGVEPVNGYWGKFPNDTRQLFRDSYFDEVMQLWKSLNPMIEETGTGVVKYPLPALFKVLGKGPWKEVPPETEEMWEVQEDIWLVDSLFQTIVSLNGGLDASRTDAVIHQIDKLELRGGGDKSKSGGGGGATGAPEGMDAGFAGGRMMGLGAAPGLAGSSGPTATPGGLASGLTVVSAEFDPTEEFGDDGSGSGTAGGIAGGMGNYAAMAANAMGDTPTTTTTTTTKTISRYVIPKEQTKPRETGPFRTRGFYLSVKMDHTMIPKFIEELSSNDKSVWPVEIIRVQMARINEDNDTSFNSPMGGGGVSGRHFPGAMAMPSPMTGGAGSFAGGIGSLAGGSSPLGAGSGTNEDLYSAFGVRNPTTSSDTGNAQQALTARAAFENALKDPVMAQVTLCGIFTLYNKVDDVPEPAAVPVVAPSAGESAPAEANNADGDEKKSAAADDSPAASATTETADPAAPADSPADNTDSPAPKGEGTIEPKTETKPDSSEK